MGINLWGLSNCSFFGFIYLLKTLHLALMCFVLFGVPNKLGTRLTRILYYPQLKQFVVFFLFLHWKSDLPVGFFLGFSICDQGYNYIIKIQKQRANHSHKWNSFKFTSFSTSNSQITGNQLRITFFLKCFLCWIILK